MNITLKPALIEDFPFLFEVFSSTRTDELVLVDWPPEQKLAFLRQQFQAQLTDYQSRYPQAEHFVVLKDSKPVGRLIVAQNDQEVRVLDIALFPTYRHKGIGTILMNRIISEALGAKRTICLMVFKYNQEAIRFYNQLGFSVTRDAGLYFNMCRSA